MSKLLKTFVFSQTPGFTVCAQDGTSVGVASCLPCSFSLQHRKSFDRLPGRTVDQVKMPLSIPFSVENQIAVLTMELSSHL